MSKFIVMFDAPAAEMAEWMKKNPEERKADEEGLKQEWDAWMLAHKDIFVTTAGVGKTKRVTTDGVADAKNDIMLYSVIEADSHEAAAAIFESHPHLKIPNAWIDISPASALPNM